MGRGQKEQYRGKKGVINEMFPTVITTNLGGYPDSCFMPRGFTLLLGF